MWVLVSFKEKNLMMVSGMAKMYYGDAPDRIFWSFVKIICSGTEI